ncbi:MAG: sialate O-acetylesterase [Phycisphaeraceae bacterium]|nr:sialate O-acetylesterase [Phycisphaeraceae bacterium]
MILRLLPIATAALFALFPAAPQARAEGKTNLFILSGQSNMAGLDHKKHFDPVIAKLLPGDKNISVRSAQGGQPIRRWYKKWKPAKGDGPKATGDLYDVLMKKVNAAIAGKKIDTITFIWMQGERDAREKHGAVYKEAMLGLVKQLRDDMKRPEINFVIGRLSDFSNGNTKYKHWDEVRKAQVEAAEADPRGAWVDTDDLNDGKNKRGKAIKNDLHYSVEGYKKLGRRFAEKAVELIKKAAPAGKGK